MVSDRTQTLLDDLTVGEMSAALERPVVPCGVLSDVGRDLQHRGRERRAA
jgi:hypothetical protein